MADFLNLPNLNADTPAFRTTWTELFAQHVNANPATTAADSLTHPTAQWGDFVDGSLAVLQAKVGAGAIINPMEYGLNPAGTALANATAIQNAIAAAPSGSTVLFPSGTFTVGHIQISNKSRIRIVGSGTTLTLSGSSATRFGIEFIGTCSFITIEGLRIVGDGVSANRHGGFFCVSGQVLSHILIRNNIIENTTQSIGFDASGAGSFFNIKIEGNTILTAVGTTAGVGYGIYLSHAGASHRACRVAENYLQQCQNVSIFHDGGAGVDYEGNTIVNHRSSSGGAQATTVGAIDVAGGQNINIRRNKFITTFNSSVYVYATATRTVRAIDIWDNEVVSHSATLQPMIKIGADTSPPVNTIQFLRCRNNDLFSSGNSIEGILVNHGFDLDIDDNSVVIESAASIAYALRLRGRGDASRTVVANNNRWRVRRNRLRVAGAGASHCIRIDSPLVDNSACRVSFESNACDAASATPAGNAFSTSTASLTSINTMEFLHQDDTGITWNLTTISHPRNIRSGNGRVYPGGFHTLAASGQAPAGTDIIRITGAGVVQTVTLPYAAFDAGLGYRVIIINDGSNAWTVAAGLDTFNSSASLVAGGTYLVMCIDASAPGIWRVIRVL